VITNERLREYAQAAMRAWNIGKHFKVKVEEHGVVHRTEKAAFVEAFIQVPLDEKGEPLVDLSW
jgi:hypothetical protein